MDNNIQKNDPQIAMPLTASAKKSKNIMFGTGDLDPVQSKKVSKTPTRSAIRP